MNGDKLNSDFDDFLHSASEEPSELLNQNILKRVKRDLDPSHFGVFLKLLSIQAFVGFLTLTFCPQFNISLTNNFDFFHYLHRTFGESICMLICGCIFVGSGAVFASYLLTSAELIKIRDSKFLYYLAITSLAVMGLSIFGTDIYINLVVFWFLGAFLGGVLLFDLNRYLRTEMRLS